jgi:hypothetical protein
MKSTEDLKAEAVNLVKNYYEMPIKAVPLVLKVLILEETVKDLSERLKVLEAK